MDNKFKMRKESALGKLAKARERGEVDLDMLPVIDAINALPGFYTTSTCTGRTALLYDPGQKLGSYWLGKWHREVSNEEVLAVLSNMPSSGKVWFMNEPTIMHAVADSLTEADLFLDLCRAAGYKRAGALSTGPGRIVLEIFGTERINAPIASEGRLLVDEDYVRFLAGLANQKHAAGMKRLERLREAVIRFEI